jgi:hypothetical protein
MNQNSTHFASSLPTELLDHICLYVEDPQDLFSFSLTAKYFYQVADPFHTHSRHLVCDFRRTVLWDMLSEPSNAAIASRIRVLEIIEESDSPYSDLGRHVIKPITPAALLESDATWATALPSFEVNRANGIINQCSSSLSKSVRRMSGLTRFCWRVEKFTTPAAVISSLKAHCPNLSEIQVLDQHSLGIYPNTSILNSKVGHLENHNFHLTFKSTVVEIVEPHPFLFHDSTPRGLL